MTLKTLLCEVIYDTYDDWMRFTKYIEVLVACCELRYHAIDSLYQAGQGVWLFTKDM
jgi:hypothetical protein